MQSSGLVLFVCAGLLLSGGAILGGSTTWNLMRMSYYFWVSDLGPELATGMLFVAGSLLCLPTCWLATLVPYHPRSLSLLASLMFLATAAMLILSTGMVSLTGLSRALREPELINASMRRALMPKSQEDPTVRHAFAAMQLELQCCGVTSYNDWFQYRSNLPPACCNRIITGKRDGCMSVNVWGCLRPALIELRNYLTTVSIVTSVIIMVLAVTLFAGAYTLVTGVLERTVEARLKQQPPTVRLACLHAQPVPSPVVSFTAPPFPAPSFTNTLPAPAPTTQQI